MILSAIVMRPSKPLRNHPVAFLAVNRLVRHKPHKPRAGFQVGLSRNPTNAGGGPSTTTLCIDLLPSFFPKFSQIEVRIWSPGCHQLQAQLESNAPRLVSIRDSKKKQMLDSCLVVGDSCLSNFPSCCPMCPGWLYIQIIAFHILI